MNRMLKSKAGFTIIELIMVITVLGFLAVVAIPEYIDLQSDAKTASEKGIVGGVRAGIATQIAKDASTGGTGAAPATLDGVAVSTGSGDNCGSTSISGACFDAVIPGGVQDSGWTKSGASSYTGPDTNIYTYASSTGAFSQN